MNATHSPAKLATLAQRVRIRADYGAARLTYDQRDEWQRKAHDYRVTLTHQRRRYSFDWWQGQAVTREPTAADCLEALLSDASSADQNFESWCADYGYDTDSRKAERTYRACQGVARRLRRLLGADYDQFSIAERS
jgi:hypothetical protein